MSCPDYHVCFVKISICDTLSQFNDNAAKWMSHALTQELEQLNISPSTKSAIADKFITKKHKKQCWGMFRSLWQNENN